jgi:hypothetical protein
VTLSGTVPATDLNGLCSNPVTFNNAGKSFTGTFNGNGAGLSNVNAATFGDPGARGMRLMRLGHSGNRGIAGTLSQGSDRAIKQDFAAVNPREILDQVVALPVRSWAYIHDASQRLLGPAAQDFHAAFGLGADDTSIATVDADGVALAAIQGLHAKVDVGQRNAEEPTRRRKEEFRSELRQNEPEITALRRRLARLEQLINHKNGGKQ